MVSLTNFDWKQVFKFFGAKLIFFFCCHQILQMCSSAMLLFLFRDSSMNIEYTTTDCLNVCHSSMLFILFFWFGVAVINLFQLQLLMTLMTSRPQRQQQQQQQQSPAKASKGRQASKKPAKKIEEKPTISAPSTNFTTAERKLVWPITPPTHYSPTLNSLTPVIFILVSRHTTINHWWWRHHVVEYRRWRRRMHGNLFLGTA